MTHALHARHSISRSWRESAVETARVQRERCPFIGFGVNMCQNCSEKFGGEGKVHATPTLDSVTSESSEFPPGEAFDTETLAPNEVVVTEGLSNTSLGQYQTFHAC